MSQPHSQSKIGTFLKGFAYTAASGALMAGIFLGVSAGIAAFAPAFALEYGIAAAGIGKGLAAAAVVGLSTGLFGGIMQVFSHEKKQVAHQAAAYSPANSRDIAITAVSQNLMSPKLQAALERAHTRESAVHEPLRPQPEQTTFRDRLARANESLNARLTGAGTSHAERITAERDAGAFPTRTLQ